MEELGELVKEYGSPRIHRILRALGLGGILLIVGGLLLSIPIPTSGPGSQVGLVGFFAIVSSIATMLMGLLLLPGTFLSRNKKTREFELGISSDWLKKGKNVILWNEIKHVAHRKASIGGFIIALRFEANDYILTLKDGSTVIISGALVKDIDQLGEHIEQHIAKKK